MEENNILRLNDKISSDDMISTNNNPTFEYKPRPLARTRVIGYTEKNGNQFGEKVFDEENQTAIGGALFILEKLFGVESGLHVENLNNIMGVVPDNQPTDMPKDNVVCLFGVGIGGCGDSIRSVKDVKFTEREITEMIPFRVTDEELTDVEKEKYWFKQVTDNKTRYYLKTFETEPTIKALWKDGEGDEDGSEVEGNVHESGRTEPIETFVELILKISKKDVREYFEIYEDIELARVNSIGLFTGCKRIQADGTKEFQQVKLFSKLNIPNEMLTLSKDLTIVYRIYTS